MIERLMTYLEERHPSETIILYGSYARGDYTKESDIDVICFGGTSSYNDTSTFEGKQLDIWVMPRMVEDLHDYLHIRDGMVLKDTEDFGKKLLEAVNKYHAQGPEKLPDSEKVFLIDWMKKMYGRTTKKDLEGHYRHHWLLRDGLELYFKLRDLWYEGPKKALRWLESNDPYSLDLYKAAMEAKPGSPKVLDLIERISDYNLERWDIYDRHRLFTGRTKPRGPLQAGEYHIVVDAWIFHEGKFLITKRHPSLPFGKLWAIPGGSAIAGETSHQAVLREVKEEIGICLTGGTCITSARRELSGQGSFKDVWVFREPVCLEDLILQEDEVIDAKWATYEDIVRMVEAGSFIGVLDYLDEIKRIK